MPNHSSGTIAVYLVEKLKPCNPFKFSAYLAGPSLRSKVALYLISYDINEKDAFEYDGLWAKLKSIGATKILYSEWVVVDEVRKANSIYSNATERPAHRSRTHERRLMGQAPYLK
jgi:hypothetical protein